MVIVILQMNTIEHNIFIAVDRLHQDQLQFGATEFGVKVYNEHNLENLIWSTESILGLTLCDCGISWSY